MVLPFIAMMVYFCDVGFVKSDIHDVLAYPSTDLEVSVALNRITETAPYLPSISSVMHKASENIRSAVLQHLSKKQIDDLLLVCRCGREKKINEYLCLFSRIVSLSRCEAEIACFRSR